MCLTFVVVVVERCTNELPAFKFDEFGYRCECTGGSKGDGYICDDIDECALETTDPYAARCDKHASCINYDRTYDCECDDGFLGDGWLGDGCAFFFLFPCLII